MIKHAETVNLKSFIETRYPLFIPKYQRGYAWEKEEVTDFCDDIRNLAGRPQNRHFFGGILSNDVPVSGSQRMDHLEIIDGQQRLSTVFIFLGALLRALEAVRAEATAQGVSDVTDSCTSYEEILKTQHLYYKEIVNNRLVDKQRMALSRVDSAYFSTLIAATHPVVPAQGSPSSNHRLFKALELVRKTLIAPTLADQTLSPFEKLIKLLALQEAVLERSYVIHVRGESRNDCYSLFKVLNDRGKDLSDAEKLRATTLELVEPHPHEQNQIEVLWDRLLSNEPRQIDRFLKAYYASMVGHRTPRDLYRAFVELLNLQLQPLDVTPHVAANILSAVHELVREFKIFAKLEDGAWPFAPSNLSQWDRVRLQRLIDTLGHTLSLPLLLAAAVGVSESDFGRCVSFLERFAFKHIIIGDGHPGSLGDVYYTEAVRIRGERAAYDLGAGLVRISAVCELTDENFKQRIKEKLIYKQNSPKARRRILYFLTVIEDFYDWHNSGGHGTPVPNSANVIVDIENLEVEHIYPQNPRDADRDETMDRLLHRIGNLTFFSPTDNRGASNASFTDKLPFFAASGVKLNQSLAGEVNWNPWEETSLNSRQEELLARAIGLFSAV